MSNAIPAADRLFRWFEIVIVVALQVLLMLLIVISTVTLYSLFYAGVRANLGKIGSAEDLQGVLQNAIGGVLIVLLGLELMETLKIYFREHHIRVEVILVVAIIGVGRHIITLDIEHVSASLLLALSTLMLALPTGYFLVRRSHEPSRD